MAQQQNKPLHIVMFPWFAIGHIRPFFHLATSLASKGHKISFISTPQNSSKFTKTPPNLSHLINLVPLRLPTVPHLPPTAESSMDVPHVKQQLLKIALDLTEPDIKKILVNLEPKPDWIVYDYSSHWLPKIAAELGIGTAFFSLFTAAFMAFLGPVDVMIGGVRSGRLTAEDFAVVPEWVTFPSNMAFRRHEMIKNLEKDAEGNEYDSGTSDVLRFGHSINGSNIVIFRSCVEFEPEWFDLVHKLYQKPIIPVGVLTPPTHDHNHDHEWLKIKSWLDEQATNSLLYVALGTEAALTKEETQALALGLEQSEFPFFWVLNRDYLFEMLPNGFIDRVKGKGMVYANWAPQVEILSHAAVGGFLTHCGWNSVTEALSFGRVLILFPVMNDQGLNARLLVDKRVGVEIERDEGTGAFTSGAVVEAIRVAMVGEVGREVRENAMRMKSLFGDERRSDAYLEGLIRCMVETREIDISKRGFVVGSTNL